MNQKKEVELGQGIKIKAFFNENVFEHLSLEIPKKSNKLSREEVEALVSWLETDVLGLQISKVSMPISPIKGPQELPPAYKDNLPKSPWDIPQRGLEEFDLSSKLDKINVVDTGIKKK